MYAAGIRGSRGSTRGGADQFSWEDVKGDANRQRYLGNSLHAAVGRWQEGKDLTWWNKKEGAVGRDGSGGAGPASADSERQLEMDTVRYREEMMRCDALGLPPPSKPQSMLLAERKDAEAVAKSASKSSNSLTDAERAALLKRRSNVDNPDRISDAGARLASAVPLDHVKKRRRINEEDDELGKEKKSRTDKKKTVNTRQKKKNKKTKKKKKNKKKFKKKKKKKQHKKKEDNSDSHSNSDSSSSSDDASSDDDKRLLMAQQFLSQNQ